MAQPGKLRRGWRTAAAPNIPLQPYSFRAILPAVDIINGSFEWDAEKAEANARKHGVTFEEAATAFADPAAVIAPDGSGRGDVFVLIGISQRARLLTVVHVERGARDRIVSAWIATAAETRLYREG